MSKTAEPDATPSPANQTASTESGIVVVENLAASFDEVELEKLLSSLPHCPVGHTLEGQTSGCRWSLLAMPSYEQAQEVAEALNGGSNDGWCPLTAWASKSSPTTLEMFSSAKEKENLIHLQKKKHEKDEQDTGEKKEQRGESLADLAASPSVLQFVLEPPRASLDGPQTVVYPQEAAVSRYPFAPMQVGWLVAYVNSLRSDERLFTMCRVLECLMNAAITMNDPVLEYAVVNFHAKFNSTSWSKAQTQSANGSVFEMCRQIFEMLGLVRKFSTANLKSKRMLLSLVDRLVDDVTNVATSSKALASSRNVLDILTSIRKLLTQLRASMDSPEILASLIQWMRYLYRNVSAQPSELNLLSSMIKADTDDDGDKKKEAGDPKDPAGGESTTTDASSVPRLAASPPRPIPCCEQCRCYHRITSRFLYFVNDVEKVKILDCLIIASVREGDEFIGNVAEDLMQRYPESFCARATNGLANAKIAMLRLRIFHCLRSARRLATMPRSALRRHYDAIQVCLARVRYTVETRSSLRHLTQPADMGLCCLYELRNSTDTTPITIQHTYTLQHNFNQIFVALSAPRWQLCVHSPSTTLRDMSERTSKVDETDGSPGSLSKKKILAEKTAPFMTSGIPRCANTSCNLVSADLLKCSGCRRAYYCSVECQKANWSTHRLSCRDQPERNTADVVGVSIPGAGDVVETISSVATAASPPVQRVAHVLRPPCFERLRNEVVA